MFVENCEGTRVYTRSDGIYLRLVGKKEDYNIISNLKFDEWNRTTLKDLGEAGYDLIHVINSGMYFPLSMYLGSPENSGPVPVPNFPDTYSQRKKYSF